MEPALRPAREQDLDFLYYLAAETDPCWLRVCGGGLPLPPVFSERVWAGVYALFVVQAPSGERLGVASIYRASERDGTCWVEAVLAPLTGHEAVPIERAVLDELLDRAFTRCGFRRAYCAYPVWSPPSLSDLWHAEEEARLTDHIFHNNLYWDYVVLAVRPYGQEE